MFRSPVLRVGTGESKSLPDAAPDAKESQESCRRGRGGRSSRVVSSSGRGLSGRSAPPPSSSLPPAGVRLGLGGSLGEPLVAFAIGIGGVFNAMPLTNTLSGVSSVPSSVSPFFVVASGEGVSLPSSASKRERRP